jgi:hypothetical protein
LNDAPVITSANSFTLDEDTQSTGSFTATDGDNDAVSYTASTQPSH